MDSQTFINDWVRVASHVGDTEYRVIGQLLRSRLNCVASGVLIPSTAYNAGFEEAKH